MDNYPGQPDNNNEPMAGYDQVPQQTPGSYQSPAPANPAGPAPQQSYVQPGQNGFAGGPLPQQNAAPGVVAPTNGSSHDKAFKKRLIIAVGGGVVLLVIIIVVAVLLTSHKTPVQQATNTPKKTSQYTGGPAAATQSTLQNSDSAISHYIGSLNNNNDFPSGALSNDNLHLN